MSGNVRIIHILPHSRDRETLERFFMEPLSDSVPRPLVIPAPPSSPRKRDPGPRLQNPPTRHCQEKNPIPCTYAPQQPTAIPAPSVIPAKAGTQAPVSKTHQPAIARKRPDSPHIRGQHSTAVPRKTLPSTRAELTSRGSYCKIAQSLSIIERNHTGLERRSLCNVEDWSCRSTSRRRHGDDPVEISVPEELETVPASR